MRQFTYTVKLTPDKDDGRYVVTCRDLPEAITQGETREEALSEAADCLEEAIAARIDDGRDIPSPSAPKRGELTVSVPPSMALVCLALVAGAGPPQIARLSTGNATLIYVIAHVAFPVRHRSGFVSGFAVR